MKISEVIRTYRKKQNLTQEQIANCLGVTAPAVNKWENAMSYPDITLLAPLARILKTDVDTLLSFHEELTDKEMNDVILRLSEVMQKKGYEKGYEMGAGLIKEYPNCDKLILNITQILFAYLSVLGVNNKEAYEVKIIRWYELVTNSEDEGLAFMAMASLGQIYMARKEYEKAQQLLDKIPPMGYDKRMMQAVLYKNQKENEKAYEIYEQMLLKSANEQTSIIQSLIQLALTEGKVDVAKQYAEVGMKLAKLMDLGEYSAYTPKLLIAVQKKEKEKTLALLEHMVNGLETMTAFCGSPLYSHIKFKEEANTKAVKEMIKRALESDSELAFIRDDIKYKKIQNKLNIE